MAVVREICNQVAIMKDGQVVEHGRTIDIFNHPKSEVARELLQKDEGNATEPKTLKTADRIKNGTRIRIVYTENSAFEPVIANMILTFKEPVNILKAATKNVGGVAKGEMILELPKGSTNVAAMEKYCKAAEKCQHRWFYLYGNGRTSEVYAEDRRGGSRSGEYAPWREA